MLLRAPVEDTLNNSDILYIIYRFGVCISNERALGLTDDDARDDIKSPVMENIFIL